ncbi:MAG TPA: beta-propeller fold lactonase family protein [Bacteroidales bacterium]|nr:beta-propeller fold lactonase family protein [Bacteroidales bacterium]
MKKLSKKYIISGAVIVILLVASFPLHKLSREHVNYYTAATDHPLNCISCHLYLKRNSFSTFLEADYYSPINVAVSHKSGSVYVVAQDRCMLLETDPEKGKTTRKVKVGNHPHSAVLSNDGRYCYVSNQWSDNISVVDLSSMEVIDTLATGNGPAGLVIDKDGRYIYAVNSFGGDISVIDLQKGTEIKRLPAGNNPTGISLSPDGGTAYVSSRRALPAAYGSPLESEITVLDIASGYVSRHMNIQSAYMMENITFTPSGDLALFTLIRPKNLVPSIQVERGFMMTHGIGIIDRKNNDRVIQLLLDEPNSFYADPFDIVVTPDGKKAFVSSSGVDCISVLSIDSLRNIINIPDDSLLMSYANNLGISDHFVIRRIYTGANPKGLDLSSDGKYLYVAEMLEDRIGIVNTETLEPDRQIDIDGPRMITMTRKGRRLLNNAGHTFQNQYSCYTCHPDAHEDGLVYNMASKDMGRNVTNTQSLRNISHTSPYKWNGKNQSVYKQDGMRFSTVLTRTEPFDYKELDAISAYIQTGIPNPPDLLFNPDGELTSAQERGKKIFERTQDFKGNEIPVTNRCVTCHPAPYYTNRQMLDVGTLSATDDSILFDVPHLNNIFASAPYLHDGRAGTLEEIWTVFGKTEQHGAVNDLTKTQLNDLIEYLRSLRDPEYENKKGTTTEASFIHH